MQNSNTQNFCVRCRTALQQHQPFCSACGTQQPVEMPIREKGGLPTWSIVTLVLVCSIIISCFLCGLFGAMMKQDEKTEVTISNTSSTPSVSPKPKQKTIIEIPKLIGQSPKFIEAQLGKPTEITPITKDLPDEKRTPGEFRDYKIVGLSKPISTNNGAMIRFYKNKAIMIMVDLPSPTVTAEEALQLAGIDVNDISPTIVAPLAKRWKNFSYNGVKYKDVNATKVLGDRYDVVQAEIELQ